MTDTKPPVETGDVVLMDTRTGDAWIPAGTVAQLQSELDKCRNEKGLRGIFNRIREAWRKRKARNEEEFDSDFPGPIA